MSEALTWLQQKMEADPKAQLGPTTLAFLKENGVEPTSAGIAKALGAKTEVAAAPKKGMRAKAVQAPANVVPIQRPDRYAEQMKAFYGVDPLALRPDTVVHRFKTRKSGGI